MKITARKAVDPIIATLLLIAIAVAAGIVVYVYVNSLAGNLTGGGGSQVSEQLSLDSYSYGTLTAPSLTVRDTGGSSVTISQVYFDGNVCTVAAATASNTCGGLAVGSSTLSTTQTSSISFTAYQPGTVLGYTAGTAHNVKVLTADGGTFTFSIAAGRNG
jgi:flagellin-like protein